VPTPFDVALVVVVAAAWPLLEYFVMWPRHVRAVDAGDARARVRVYQRTLMEEWVLAAAVMALTLASARPLATLGLRAPEGWRLWLGAAIPLVYGWLVFTQGRALGRKP